MGNRKHGETTKTGQSREYAVYHAMLQRCYNPKDRAYKNYGARGIEVCQHWQKDFANFLADMGRCPDGLSLERVDNDGWYSPDNCVWAERWHQNRNHRRNRRITVNGRTMVASDWFAELGVPARTFYNRLARGLSDLEALGL